MDVKTLNTLIKDNFPDARVETGVAYNGTQEILTGQVTFALSFRAEAPVTEDFKDNVISQIKDAIAGWAARKADLQVLEMPKDKAATKDRKGR